MEKKIKQKSVADVIDKPYADSLRTIELQAEGLTSLEGSPEKVEDFIVVRNNLKNLIGGPKIVKYYYANDNQLETLEGAPEEVEVFGISHNPTLKNTNGIPKRVRILDLHGTHSVSQFTQYPEYVEEILFDNTIPIEDVKQIIFNIKRVQYVHIGDMKHTRDEILEM